MRLLIQALLGGPILASQALNLSGGAGGSDPRPKLQAADDQSFQGRAKKLGASSADNQNAENKATDSLQKTLKAVTAQKKAAKPVAKEAPKDAAKPVVAAAKEEKKAEVAAPVEKKVEAKAEVAPASIPAAAPVVEKTKATEEKAAPTGKKVEAAPIVAAAKATEKVADKKEETKKEEKVTETKKEEKATETKKEEPAPAKKEKAKKEEPVVAVVKATEEAKAAETKVEVTAQTKIVKAEVVKDTEDPPAAEVEDVKKAEVNNMKTESNLGVPEPGDWDMIKEYRAQKCSERPDPAHHEPCLKFMEPICNPGGEDGMEGKKLDMNGEKGENGSGKGYCAAFYNNVNKQLCEEKGGNYCDKDAKKEEKKEEKSSDEGKDDGKTSDGASEEDWKKDLAADGSDGTQAPEGLSTAHAHEDGETSVQGFGEEYGPSADGKNFREICNQPRYKWNQWCKTFGDGETDLKSKGYSPEVEEGPKKADDDKTYVDLWSALFWGVLLLVGTGLCLFVAFRGRSAS